MAARFAWVLNLDADFELAAGAKYQPTKPVRDATREHAKRLIGTLTGPNDIVVDEESAPDSARRLAGVAFCPTPRAIAMLLRAGAEPVEHPSFEIIRRVNSRAFCQSLGQTLPNASFETDLDAALEKLGRDPEIGNGWRVKRAFGVAGRGQRVVRPGEATPFLASWIEDGGVQIEPNVSVIEELAMHGMLSRDGEMVAGATVIQKCDAAGAWLESVRAPDHPRASDLHHEMERVGNALHRGGYFGPFGIDAYEWSGGFQSRSEINARYSMAFAVGFSKSRAL